MSISVLVIGESGTGKSTSLRNLNPEETFLIKVIDKPLPFKNKYKPLKKSEPGNYYVSDNHEHIIRLIGTINNAMPHIKTCVIDDFQYIMANEFMRKSDEKGYDKFTNLAKHVWEILNAVTECRSDLSFFVLSHSDDDGAGKVRAKTIGKLLNNQITVEGLFTIVLHSRVIENRYIFMTQNDGVYLAKSPMDMFPKHYIDNDLQQVKVAIDAYYNDPGEDIPQ